MWLGTIVSPRLRRGLFRSSPVKSAPRRIASFTLVEMLIAMAITLVMMGAVVTLFANISNSVKNRRATIEMSGQLRRVRNALQQDLQGATCPGVTWQRPESNHGYIEINEGQYREGYASSLVDGIQDQKLFNPEIDHKTSILPSSNLPFTSIKGQEDWVTDGAGLGDYDDVLMLTVRNEHEPFVGRMPSIGNGKSFKDWESETLQSTLAEVIWFAIENPGYTDDTSTDPDPTGKHFFGEPGMRTIYRRTLLIAPWVNPYKALDDNNDGLVKDANTGLVFKAVPGLVRMLGNVPIEKAIAATIAFQDRYDMSVRLEWDHSIKAYKIMANTLGDLTKRENRFGHFFYRPQVSTGKVVGREYPFALMGNGSGYSSTTAQISFVDDPDTNMRPATSAKATANILSGVVVSYTVDPTKPGNQYQAPPFAFVDAKSTTIATARVMLNDDGQVVRLVFGPTPLWGVRRGQDVMMTDALAFDLRVYDPGAPLFASRKVPNSNTDFTTDTVLTPSDPGWLDAYMSTFNMGGGTGSTIGTSNTKAQVDYLYVGQGAYVDLGYGYNSRYTPPTYPGPPALPSPVYGPLFSSSAAPWFFEARPLSDVYLNSRPNLSPPEPKDSSYLATGYAVYDTWSFHYENNGVNEDQLRYDGNKWQVVDNSIDEGTNGMDDVGAYTDTYLQGPTNPRLGVDDIGEHETAPPYDKPLRGMQVVLRAYERDSRSIRQVRVTQHFMPE
jgi:type II secretory pathway pseudopilin PulG